jgi:DNA-binding NarL/FixJ family response regulator
MKTNKVPSLDLLSRREQEICTLLGAGKACKEVASDLNLAVKTVETHKSNIYRKLEIHNVTDAVHFALAFGLVANKFQTDRFYGS